MDEHDPLATEGTQTVSEVLGDFKLLYLRVVTGVIALGTFVSQVVLIAFVAGEHALDVPKFVFPGDLTLWIYSPVLLPVGLAVFANSRPVLLAAVAVALSSGATLLLPLLEIVRPSDEVMASRMVSWSPLPALLLAGGVYRVVSRWARQHVPDGRIIR